MKNAPLSISEIVTGEAAPDEITISNLTDAHAFGTTDGYVLLRIRTHNRPMLWLRMTPEDYAGLASFMVHDAAERLIKH